MKNFLTLGRKEYSSDRSGVATVWQESREPECPAWLAKKYRTFRAVYKFGQPSHSPADLVKILRISTGEFAAIYQNEVYHPQNRNIAWTETYMWVWRDDRMVELSQRGQNGKRQLMAAYFS